MPLRSFRIFAFAACAALATACAGGTSNSVIPSQVGFAPSIVADTVPPPCKSQTTKKTYASVTANLSTHGGTLCIPAFRGFGGSIEYPGTSPSVSVTITTSTTNYNHKMTSLSSGKPLLYVQIAISGATHFSSHAIAGGGIASKLFKPGSSYSAYGAVEGFPITLGSCHAIAKTSKFGGEIEGIGTLLKDQTVPAAITGYFEVYAGATGKGAC